MVDSDRVGCGCNMLSGPDLSTFDNRWYNPGRSSIVCALWFFCALPVLRSSLIPSSALRRCLLRLFGADIGRSVVIKPGVRVKYPWLLSVGDNSWIGEDVWIDNLARVAIGRNACVSQGAYLCTGNHDWSDRSFALVVKSIALEDGAWIGAKAVICPGVTVRECGVVAAGSLVSTDVPSFEVHAGNPACFVCVRRVRLVGIAGSRR